MWRDIGVFGWKKKKAVPLVIQEARHYWLADRRAHLDKLFCGEGESETNRAALGLARTPWHRNTFFKPGWPRYFSFIAAF